ncbi:MAG: glycosyltransferase family 39 protein [Pseudomonadota bacterium]
MPGTMTLLDRIATGWKAYLIVFLITFTAAAPGVFQLPALDRDESRFAQASKQMLETGDYIRIRYQDELRNKKPAGIHWLQAASTAAFSDASANEIWSYRIPSWIGASLAAAACLWAGTVLIGRTPAFLGSSLFGATLLLTSEAHISKTDAVLVALTTLGLGALARLYMRGDNDKKIALLFWAAMGLGFLIKGPVTPMVAAFAAAVLYVWDRRDARWLRVLAWWPGPVLFVALVLPWFIWVQIATSGEYLQGAVGKDLRDKLVSASEGHGGPPGYHLLHVPVWFFPATLFLIPGLYYAWQGVRRSALETVAGEHRQGLKFLIAWGLPTWIFFELLLTKLSHYILPAYPALALFCGYGAWRLVEAAQSPRSGLGLRIGSAALFAIGGAALLAVSTPIAAGLIKQEAYGDFRHADPTAVAAQWSVATGFPMALWYGAAAAFILSLLAFGIKRIGTAAALAVVTAMVAGWHARSAFLPSQVWVQPTEQARAALEAICARPGQEGSDCKAPAMVQSVGYAEPSYILRIGTESLHPPETVVDLPDSPDALPVAYLIDLEHEAGLRAREALTGEAEDLGYCKTESVPRYALNYSNGDPVTFIAVRFDPGPCPVPTEVASSKPLEAP